LFNTAEELLKLCQERNMPIGKIALETEIKATGVPEADLLEKMRKVLQVMRDSASAGLTKEIKSLSGLSGGNALKMNGYAKASKTLCGATLNQAMARAYSSSEINSAMGRIAAAPTAGSCGILPAVVITASEIYHSSEETILLSLFTASAIGAIIANSATLSGAEGGCQAECGAATAMAAAAAVELAGGTPAMSVEAGAIALKCILGLVCDPVAGLVEVPCAKRNAMGAVNALAAADMALAGVKSLIPFDEVVTAMYKIGRSLPCELKETALGGLAATPTGKKIAKKILGE
jgi:L-serine dehydratase